MGKLILSMMTSLDGHVARPDGNLDWFLSDAEFEEEMLGLLRNVDSMIFGRVSYEMLAQYWPTAGDSAQEAPGGFTTRERAREFAQLMNSVPKIVYSSTLDKPQWGPVTVARAIDPDEITRRKQNGGDIVLFAGRALARSFAKLDLFDEYRLMIHPVVLGNGLSLFEGLDVERALRLQRARTLPSGVVLLQYRRALRSS